MHTRAKAKNKDKTNHNTSSSQPTSSSNSSSVQRQPRAATNKSQTLVDVEVRMENQQFERDPILIQNNEGNQRARRAEANMERPVGDYITPTIGDYNSPIYVPEGEGFDFDIKGNLIHMVKSDPFTGYGNPHYHLSNFTELCRTYKTAGVPQEIVYMKLFPFSLTDKARDWLQSHEPNTFRTWEALAQAFVKQYFPPAKVKKIRDKISKFVQFDNESFYEAYERFRGLFSDCPHHGFNKWELLSAFYDEMYKNGRARMDQVSGGGIMELTPTEGFNIIEKIARNSHQWGGERNHLKKEENNSSSKIVTRDDLDSLAKIVKDLAQSVGKMSVTIRREQPAVYEVKEVHEETYDPTGQIKETMSTISPEDTTALMYHRQYKDKKNKSDFIRTTSLRRQAMLNLGTNITILKDNQGLNIKEDISLRDNISTTRVTAKEITRGTRTRSKKNHH